MTVPEDEDAIEALTPERAHEPLRERVRSRCLDRGANDPWPLGAEHLVEAADVLTVTVADEEAEGTAVPPGDEVARLLADPGSVGIGGDAREVHRAGCDLELFELTLDAPIAPGRVLLGEADNEPANPRLRGRGAGPPRVRPATRHERAVPAVN